MGLLTTRKQNIVILVRSTFTSIKCFTVCLFWLQCPKSSGGVHLSVLQTWREEKTFAAVLIWPFVQTGLTNWDLLSSCFSWLIMITGVQFTKPVLLLKGFSMSNCSTPKIKTDLIFYLFTRVIFTFQTLCVRCIATSVELSVKSKHF